MKVAELIPGKRYKTNCGGTKIVTYIGVTPGYENPPADWNTDGNTLVDAVWHGRLYCFSSRDLIEEA